MYSCLYLNAAIVNDNQQIYTSTSALTSSNNQQVPPWKCHQQNIKWYHKRHNRNKQHLQNQEQEDCFQYTQETTSAHNKQQATTNKHTSNKVKMMPEDLTAKNQHKAKWAPQQQWHLLNQEQDCFHDTQPSTTRNNQQPTTNRLNGTRRLHCQEPTRGIIMIITSMISLRNTFLA